MILLGIIIIVFHHDVVASRRRPVHTITYYYYYIGIIYAYTPILYYSMISFNANSIFHWLFVGSTVVTGYKKKTKKITIARTSENPVVAAAVVQKYTSTVVIIIPCACIRIKNRTMTAGDDTTGLCRCTVGKSYACIVHNNNNNNNMRYIMRIIILWHCILYVRRAFGKQSLFAGNYSGFSFYRFSGDRRNII